MADVLTLTYDFTQPEIGGSDDTWGDKLNANWGKLDDLLTSVFPSGGPTTLGIPLLASTTPTLRFLETDAVSPVGQFGLYGSATGSFSFVRYTAAAWGSPTNIWSYTAPTDTFYIAPLTRLSTGHGVVEIGSSTSSQISFMRAGVNYIKWPNAASLRLQTDTSVDAMSISGTAISMYPELNLAVTNGSVNIGHSTSSTINFQRAGINYIRWPNAGSFYLQTDTSVNVLVASGTIFNTYPETSLALTDGVVNIGNTSNSIIEFKRPSGGINYLKVLAGTTLKVQTTAGGTWAEISSGSGWQAGSDARLKQNIVDIPYGLDSVLALRPVAFDWLEDGRHDIGLVAQEVQPLVPEVVSVMSAEEGEEAMLGLRKDALVAVLIKAMQELTARVVALEGA